MNIKLLIPIVLIAAIAAGYLALQNGIADQFLPEILSTKVSRSQALENVKKLPEVQDYLKRVPKALVEVDNETEGEYNVQVYEVKNGHTATFNWYKVSIKSGEITPEFEIQPEQENESSASQGTVTGKLCYPSEVLPKGVIEAKRPSDNSIFTIDYPGSENGGKNTYSIDLEEGDYYLRYALSDSFSGYSTTVCPTGMEESCGDTKQRELRKASVKTGQTVSGYDLCDFYYQGSNAPKF